MSRILRRPMFRGGRVDARGTGIASGLGYAGGGSVNTPRRGFVTGPGGYAGIPQHKTGAEIIEEVYAKPWLPYLGKRLPPRSVGTTATGEASGVNTTDEFIPNPERIIRGQVTGGGMKRNPNYKPPTRTVERNVRGSKSTVQQPLTKEEIAFTTEGDHPGQVMLKPEVESDIYKPAPDTTPEKTKAEKLAEYQEMFEEAYGSGRGEDISNMLLSFAGKALKPEATVKSSFGEFFEEEAKRPSERKKYKDAATTAAINAYLAGEKDFTSLMNQMKVMEHGVDYKAGVETAKQKAYTINDYVVADKSGSMSQAVKKGARKVIEANNLGTKGLQIIKEKDANDPKLLDPKNVGEVFMDEDNNIVFQIIIEDGVIIKDFLYR